LVELRKAKSHNSLALTLITCSSSY